ncbi:MAG: PAS domain-containing protein [Chloroflexi bacterium]|nr:PAS domain-containing protein [Chloroflexota bacterium]
MNYPFERLSFKRGLENEQKTPTARLTRSILLITLAINLVNIAATLLVNRSEVASLNLNILVLFVQFVSFILFQGGHVRLATVIVIVVCFAAITFAALPLHGVANPIFALYTAVILMAGLLLSGRAALVAALLSILIGVAFVLAGPGLSEPALSGWILYSSLFLFVALVLIQARRSVDTVFAQVEQHQTAMVASHARLVREIEEREKTENALRENEQRFRVALAASPVIVFNHDLELRYTWIYNPAGGLQPEDIIGKRDSDLVSSDEAEVVMAIKQRVIDTGAGAREMVSMTVGGTLSLFELTAEPLRDRLGSIIGVTCAVYDVTERRRAEQQLTEAETLRREAISEREIVQLKEDFIAFVAHEFRTPLTVILSAKEALRHYFDRLSPERRAQHLEEIEIQSRYMVTMLDNVLTLNRFHAGKQAFQPELLDVVTFSASLMEKIRLTDPDSHRFVFSISGSRQSAYIDEHLLRHILGNLLSNAIKYSPGGTEIRFGVVVNDHVVTFTVADDGIGIPPKDVSRLFELFHRASNVHDIKGTGLGLAIVKNSVDAHGGTIQVASEEGRGTTFTVCLPANAPQTLIQ